MAVSTDRLGQADAIRENHAANIDRLRNRQDLSVDAKRTGMARVHLKAKAQMAELEAKATGEQAGRKAQLTSKVFGLTDVAGTRGLDQATASVSYRDAQDRAAAIKNMSEALALLARAERSGDELLARAVAGHAYDIGMQGVVDTYLATRPDKAQALAELQQLDSNGGVFGAARNMFAWVLSVPPELAGIPDRHLAVMADNQNMPASL